MKTIRKKVDKMEKVKNISTKKIIEQNESKEVTSSVFKKCCGISLDAEDIGNIKKIDDNPDKFFLARFLNQQLC
ncbi:hypothetical protein ACFLSS_03785 [Bacteroidota bacterium]